MVTVQVRRRDNSVKAGSTQDCDCSECILGCTSHTGYEATHQEVHHVDCRTHPSGIDGAGIEGLRGSVVVVEGDSIRVGHTSEDLQLGLRYLLGSLEVCPKHSLVTIGGCQTALQREAI